MLREFCKLHSIPPLLPQMLKSNLLSLCLIPRCAALYYMLGFGPSQHCCVFHFGTGAYVVFSEFQIAIRHLWASDSLLVPCDTCIVLGYLLFCSMKILLQYFVLVSSAFFTTSSVLVSTGHWTLC